MIEATLINIVSKIAPWLATFPTAWAIGLAVSNRLHWPWIVAAIVGVSVETLGVASAATALDLWSYQRSKRKSDPSAPVFMGAALVATYFVGVILLTVVLDGNLYLAVFPVLSLVGVGNLALRSDQSARLASVADSDERERQERSERQERKRLEATKNPSEMLADYTRSAPALSTTVAATLAETAATVATLEACPHCGRSEFSNRYQRSAHIGKCPAKRSSEALASL